jgi:hypothetical protein
MSFKLVKKVVHTDRVDGMHKLVLIILADYVNESKGNASWPALTTVAQQAGLSSRHTRRIVRDLENEGVLKTIQQAGLRGTNKYVIDVDSPPKSESGADTHVLPRADTHVRGGADIHDTRGGHPCPGGADTHVLRTYKEQIRTDTFGGAPGSALGATASLENPITNSGHTVRVEPDGAPKCTEHTQPLTSCATCYTWQHEQWRKEPLS